MNGWPTWRRVAALAGAALLLGAGFFAFARPWLLDWGATPSERRLALPGDEIVPGAASTQTRAIDIVAPPAQVWPWLAQLGQDRGGFYSYEILEDLVGCEMTNVYHLDPALQQWTLGDKQWMYPPRKLGGVGHNVLLVLEPGHALGFGTHQFGTAMAAPPDGSWSYVVEPAGTNGARLLIRGRSAGGYGWFAAGLVAALFDPIHFVMERKTMVTIKALAEGRSPPPKAADDWQVFLWASTFAALVASAVLLLRGRQPGRHLATFVAAGLLLQVLPLLQPSPVIGTPLVAALLFSVCDSWTPFRGLRSRWS